MNSLNSFFESFEKEANENLKKEQEMNKKYELEKSEREKNSQKQQSNTGKQIPTGEQILEQLTTFDDNGGRQGTSDDQQGTKDHSESVADVGSKDHVSVDKDRAVGGTNRSQHNQQTEQTQQTVQKKKPHKIKIRISPRNGINKQNSTNQRPLQNQQKPIQSQQQREMYHGGPNNEQERNVQNRGRYSQQSQLQPKEIDHHKQTEHLQSQQQDHSAPRQNHQRQAQSQAQSFDSENHTNKRQTAQNEQSKGQQSINQEQWQPFDPKDNRIYTEHDLLNPLYSKKELQFVKNRLEQQKVERELEQSLQENKKEEEMEDQARIELLFKKSETPERYKQKWIELYKKGLASNKNNTFQRKISSGKFRFNEDGQREMLPDMDLYGKTSAQIFNSSWTIK